MNQDLANRGDSALPLTWGDAQFRAVFESAAIGIALVDLTGRPVKCNHALEQILGYSEAELSLMKFTDFTHPEDIQKDLDLYQSLVSGERSHYQIEKRYIRKDQKIVWARLTVSMVHTPSGGAELVIGMVENITDRKVAEEALRESEEKFFKAFHGNPNPTLITCRSNGRILEVNEAFAQWFGVTTAAAKNKTTLDFEFWNTVEERRTFLKRLQREGSVRDYRKTIRLPSGECRNMLLSVLPLSLRGEDCMLTISIDITQQVQAEQALKQSEERLRRGLAAARMGIWEWDVITDSIFWTPEVYSLFGLEPAAFGANLNAFLSTIAAEDVDRVEREIKEVLQNPGRKYYSEMRIRLPDGTGRWLESRGEVRRAPSGKPLMMLGTVTDVTERKRAEAALRSSEESLRATIENTPGVAVQWYDQEGRVVFWNHASENIFGWKAAEARGKTLDQLIFEPDENDRFKTQLKKIESTGEPIPPIEFRFRRRDGSKGYCVSTVFCIPANDHGFCFVCMDVDITARKEAEESVRELQKKQLRAREEFTRSLLNAEEQERQRLAAELHDSLGQSLSIIKNKAYLALKEPGLPATVVEHLKTISQSTEETIAELRQIVRNLRPLQIEQLGLTDSIRELLEKTARSTSIQLEYRIEEVDDVIKGNAATHLYRIVQESLNNLFKHSEANRATLTLERDIKCVRLRLQDNGAGFDTEGASVSDGFGLKSIGERAQMLGGNLSVDSILGSGTALIVELPFTEDHENKP